MAEAIAFKPVYLPQNKGLGNALKEALANCSNNLVARMDSDDISAPYRFGKQLEVFTADPDVDIVGGSITEFVGSSDNITGERQVELTDTEIKKDMHRRCTMNHVSVMYKKNAVLASGGYLDWHYNEDYYLWIRMLEHGCKFANVPYPLVNVRTGADMSARRGGWKYFRSEQTLQRYMLERKLISFPRYVYNVALRFGGEFVAPNSVRQLIYKAIRKEYDPTTIDETLTVDAENAKQLEYPPFSVATSVYGKDNAEWFDTALNSIIVKQTVKPSEVVLVVDGPVPQSIQEIIDKYAKICRGGVLLKVIRFEQNKGLGEALRVAVENCSHELIARMDSDDIAVENRFELQLSTFIRHPDLTILGGQIEEFITTPDEVVGKREVPETDDDLKDYMKRRCPFNHMTVMFRRTDVLKVGNYQDWFWNEDYFLWIRMALDGMKFGNLPETLVNVRVSAEMYSRRGGAKYFKSEVGIQKYMLEHKLISKPTFVMNCGKRLIVQKLLPNKIRGWVFRTFARS